MADNKPTVRVNNVQALRREEFTFLLNCTATGMTEDEFVALLASFRTHPVLGLDPRILLQEKGKV